MSYLDWKVGDRVVCVNASGALHLREGEVYTIRGFDCFGFGYSQSLGEFCNFGVFLDEACPNPGDDSFAPSRFRKVQTRKTDIGIFTAMLHRTDRKVPA